MISQVTECGLPLPVPNVVCDSCMFVRPKDNNYPRTVQEGNEHRMWLGAGLFFLASVVLNMSSELDLSGVFLQLGLSQFERHQTLKSSLAKLFMRPSA